MFSTQPLTHILSHGSQLWIIQGLSQLSVGNVTLNWHLQFLPKQKTSQPLLIDSSQHLPCQKVCFLPLSSNPLDWIQKAHQLWSDLNKPSLKIILPDSISETDLKNNWKVEPLPYKIKLIHDKTIKN